MCYQIDDDKSYTATSTEQNAEHCTGNDEKNKKKKKMRQKQKKVFD